jgi:hypothetical protein
MDVGAGTETAHPALPVRFPEDADMHVAHCSEDLLVVEHRPSMLGALLVAAAVGGPFVLFHTLSIEGLLPTLLAVFMIDFPLLVLFAVAVRRLMIVLDRRRNRLSLHERSLFRDREFERPLAALVRAEEETNWTQLPYLPPHGSYRRAILVLAEDRQLCRVPVTSVYLVGPSARRTARAINAFLGRPLDFKAPRV